MTIRNSFLAAPLAVLALAVPAVAQQDFDMSSMTCGDLKALDETGQMAVSTQTGYMMTMQGMSEEEKQALETQLGEKLDGMSESDRYNAMYSAVEEAENNRVATLSESDRESEEQLNQDRLEALLTACETDDAMLVNDAAMGMSAQK